MIISILSCFEFILSHIITIIMTEEYVLPKISTQTREKLSANGFENSLYNSSKLPKFYIPRGEGFDAYTYLIMGLGASGAVIAKRFGGLVSPFMFAVLAAPFMSIIMKKEVDFLWNSSLSKKHASLVLQQYPLLNQSFKQVLGEVNTQIEMRASIVRNLQQQLSRKQQQ